MTSTGCQAGALHRSTPRVWGAGNNPRNGHMRWKSGASQTSRRQSLLCVPGGWRLCCIPVAARIFHTRALQKEVLYRALSLGGVGSLSGPQSRQVSSVVFV